MLRNLLGHSYSLVIAKYIGKLYDMGGVLGGRNKHSQLTMSWRFTGSSEEIYPNQGRSIGNLQRVSLHSSI